MKTLRLLCATILLALSAAQAVPIWIEAESASALPASARADAWNNPALLSGGSALTLFAEPAEVEAKIPADGAVIGYEFDAPAGERQIWARVGFENIRPPFAWRINGGPWQTNSQTTHRTIDVVETAFWNPIGWTRMGAAKLAKGRNTLEVRISRRAEEKDGKDSFAPVRFVTDAFCLAEAAWVPDQHRPPGGDTPEADRAAAAHVFRVPGDLIAKARAETPLDGAWEYAPWEEQDEITEETRAKGADSLPDLAPLPWRAVRVPGDRNTLLPDHRFQHRYILRTRVEIPAAWKGRSFLLDLREINMIATLFVDGKKVGDHSAVLGFWTPDITPFITPGKTHEIALVIKDAFYAMRPTKEGETMRANYYLPMSLFETNQGTTHRFDFPVKGAAETGILEGATLVATGPGYVEDAFVKTSVAEHTISATLRLRTPGDSPRKFNVIARVESHPDGTRELAFPQAEVRIPAGAAAEIELSSPWPGAKLWWPDQPALHDLVVEVLDGDKVCDVHRTRFGFREWQIRGNQFYLNGIRWKLRADLLHYNNPNLPLDQVRADWEKHGINMFRLRFQYAWGGMRYGQTLAWMDEQGMPVRLHAGSFDGQHASYDLGSRENPNPGLYARWHEQLENRVRRWRNHPSVFIWELDNEIIYINARNLGKLDAAEPEFTKAAAILANLDPTRTVVTGGGNALRDESLPVYGCHYFEVADRDYPREAYTLEKSLARQNGKASGGLREPWPLDFEKKPLFLSETAFLPGRNAAGFAAIGGEVTFLGKAESRPTAGLIARFLAEGYRWKGVAAMHFWFDDAFTGASHYSSFQPVAAFVREWNSAFAGGQKVARTVRVFNETRFSDPLDFAWALTVAGNRVAGETRALAIPPGLSEEISIELPFPSLKGRAEANLDLSVKRGGTEVFRDTKRYAVLEPDAGPKPRASGPILVWDPDGAAARRLASRRIPFNQVGSFAEIPDRFGLLIVGKNAVAQNEATDSRWMALAAAGNRIVVLDQKFPLHFQALPADLEPTSLDGHSAFIQEPNHPVFDGLQDSDFFVWDGDGAVYRKAYRKASRGARSLAHCDNELAYSALSACPVNDGLIVVSQFALGQRLESSAVAQRLFDNLVAYAASYRLEEKPVALCTEPATPAGQALFALGVRGSAVTDPLAAIRSGTFGIVAVQATPEAMRALASDVSAVRAYAENGGWVMILGVLPETLADFNTLVGYAHIIRPFRMEKVRFAPRRDPLSAGLGLQDVVMSSGERIQAFNRDEWPVDDAFVGIVDLEDVAPFAEFPPPAYWGDPDTKGPGDDTWPLNMVNGYLSDTHWRMIFSIHLNHADPTKWDIKLPREEEITGFAIAPNRLYHEITRLRLTFDGDASSAQEFAPSGGDRQDFDVRPTKAKTITVELLEWKPKGTSNVIGVDNLWIRAKRPADFHDRVKPLLNIGGLVKYPVGKGGFVLNQYRFTNQEKNPNNAVKKRLVTATLLRNLGAAFAVGKTVVAGAGLAYRTAPLEGACNLYLKSDQGFPDQANDLSALPVGRHRFASVDYEIRDFATSPLESGAMLKHPRYRIENEKDAIRDIPLHGTADALFFLHTLLPGDAWKPRNDADDPPAAFRYIIRYGDGTTETVPVTLGRGIAPWLQDDPRSLPDAALAWSAPAKQGGKTVAVYSFQWTNPNPGKPLQSVSLEYAGDGPKWGTPVLLGITAAEARR